MDSVTETESENVLSDDSEDENGKKDVIPDQISSRGFKKLSKNFNKENKGDEEDEEDTLEDVSSDTS